MCSPKQDGKYFQKHPGWYQHKREACEARAGWWVSKKVYGRRDIRTEMSPFSELVIDGGMHRPMLVGPPWAGGPGFRKRAG